jgi:hypothetical protein
VNRYLNDWCITKELALDRRVEASNSCVRALIFSYFLLLPFVKFFSMPLVRFFDIAFYYCFSFLILFFIALCFFLHFRSCFIPVFFAHMVLSLCYPQLTWE